MIETIQQNYANTWLALNITSKSLFSLFFIQMTSLFVKCPN